MIQVFINKNFLYNLLALPFEEQEYFYSFLKKIVAFELFVDIKKNEILILENEYPQVSLIFCEQATIKFTEVAINQGYIENKAIEHNTFFAKLFFLEFEDDCLDQFSKRYGYLFCNTKTISSGIEQFFNGDIDKWNNHELVFNRKLLNTTLKYLVFEKWSDLARRATPSCFILINDRYCLNDKPNQSVKNNIAQLLISILKNLSEATMVTFIITSEKLNFENEEYFVNYLTNILNVNFRSRFTIKVLFIDRKKNFIGDNHPRIIASNYFYIESNDSFNYFNDNDNLKQKNFLIHYKNILTSYPTCMVLKQFYSEIINYIKLRNIKGFEMLLK